MTPRQEQVLAFVVGFIRERGMPPTLREIAAQFQFASVNTARCVLQSLAAKGKIRVSRYRARAIEVLEPRLAPSDMLRVPIVGRVAAGTPLLAVDNLEGELALDRALLRGSGDIFALRVQGHSMVEAGIHDGDLVLARPDLPLEPGAIVVAVIRGEATVKRYRESGDLVRLEPANPHFPTLAVRRDDPELRIAGRVVGLFRRY